MSAAMAVLPLLWACEQAPFLVENTPKPKPEPVEPVLAFYRKYTEAMLRQYLRFAMVSGRVPSMLGKEMFRSKVTHYRVESFEDAVIFVHDVDKCIRKLDQVQQVLVTRIAVQQYTHEEAAEMLGIHRRTVIRRYDQALDRLTAIFLEAKLLEPQKLVKRG